MAALYALTMLLVEYGRSAAWTEAVKSPAAVNARASDRKRIIAEELLVNE